MKIRTLITLAAAVGAPKLTRRLRHPVKSAKRAIVLRGLRSYLPERRTLAALGGLVAAPLALFVAKRIARR